ncbi:hypothetical protein JKP88DRAFT_254477 [Tribonema minus]|uniref:Uncharacterized protein n=1 Tax=Tribonema minus TaxID=303371 RepID=A0A835ZCS7_9STRA|nr:hypothetical protein JKP88DRAFT_254477 [Tribonema minus]
MTMLSKPVTEEGAGDKRLFTYAMSETVLKKQKRCVRGAEEDVTIYISAPVADVQLINFALYPGPRAQTETARTEKEMRKLLNAGVEMAWVDLCCISANVRNDIIDQGVIASWVVDDEIIHDFYHRFSLQLAAAASIPFVYIAGRTCQAAFERMITLGFISRMEELSSLGVTLCEAGDFCFAAIEGRPHPSHHLVTGREVSVTGIFEETIAMINGVVSCCASGDLSPGNTSRCLIAAMSIDEEELAVRMRGREYRTHLLYSSSSGRFPLRDIHLRNVKAHLPEVRATLSKWAERGINTLMSILRSGNIYLDLPAYNSTLDVWFERLGAARFVTFMCNGIAARLLNPLFAARLEIWFERLGAARFVTFMCDSIAPRLLDPLFAARLEIWFERLGAAARFVTFMCDSIAARLLDPLFAACLDIWIERLGAARFVTFMCGGVAARLLDPLFSACLDVWFERLGAARFVTFMCGGVAARLLDPLFAASLDIWFERLGAARFVTFMCNGIAARLLDPLFAASLEIWFERLGAAARFVTFMCDSIAARLLDPLFAASLDIWFERLGAARFVTFMCNGIAARLLDPLFTASLDIWFERLGAARFVTFMCGGIAARLLDPLFAASLDIWFERLGAARFVTFMCGGIAARLLDPLFAACLEIWFERLGAACSVTLMCNGVAARMLKPTFQAITSRWFNALGAQNFARIFGIGGFTKRIVNASFERRAVKVLHTLGGDAMYTFLRANDGRKMDNI